jgi:hypothetical protein
MSRGLRRSTGRQSTTTAEPSLRRAKKSGTCESGLPGIDPVQPKRLGRDADHGRVEVQIQQVRVPTKTQTPHGRR